MAKFEKPYAQVRAGEKFNSREVGITHPDNGSFIKIADNGDIEISAGEGISIILHPQNKSITIIADSIKFMVKDRDAIRINNLILNTDATKYSEPTFVPSDPDEMKTLYGGTMDYVVETDRRKVIDPATKDRITWDEYIKLYNREPSWNGSFFEQVLL